MSQTRAYIGASLIAIAGLFAFVLIKPTYDDIIARREALTEREQMVSEQTAILNRLKDLKQQATERANDIEQFSNIVPAAKNTADLVAMLQALANQNGLEMTALAMGSTQSTQDLPYNAQDISIGLAGGYIPFRSFIDDLEKNIRIIDIDSIDAAPITEGASIIRFSVKARAYFLPK